MSSASENRSLIVGESPTVETRIDQPYAAIPVSVTMEELGTVVPPLTGQVVGWLAGRGISPAGPPFWRYVVVDMEAKLELETGVPVASQVEGDEQVRTGLLPAGRYATVVHTGHPDTLVTATRGLLDWAAERGFDWDADGSTWGCRLEEYLSDPDEVPDMNEWQTRLAFRLRD
jgi:effector-binding domain-containing protein